MHTIEEAIQTAQEAANRRGYKMGIYVMLGKYHYGSESWISGSTHSVIKWVEPAQN